MMAVKVDPVGFLKERYGAETRFLYMPNGGNLGDGLIAAATIQKFREHRLNWDFMRGGKENVKSTDVLVYGGGGGLIGLYPGGVAALRFLLTMGRPVVVLPHTIRDFSDFWSSCGPITVFAREQESYDYLKQFPDVELYAAHDMAIGFDLCAQPFQPTLNIRNELVSKSLLSEELSAFRGDNESKAWEKSGSNIDISDLAYPTMRTTEEIMSMAMFFFMALASYQRIKTDRLHVSIAAAILGIDVELYDNSYKKNSSIYEFSIKERFPAVKLVL